MSILQRTRALQASMAACLAMIVAACTVPGTGEDTGSRSSNITDRWQPPQSSASGTYEGVNGEQCSGGLKPGTKALGDQIKQQFGFSYGGYACRSNTADSSQLSIHAVGRALDIMTSSGDEVANYLVENADTLGVQLIIWNRTLWKITPSGATSRQYTGPNPHTDHVHAEVTSATAENGPGATDGTGTSEDGAYDTADGGTDDCEYYGDCGSYGDADGGAYDDGYGDGYNDDGYYDDGYGDSNGGSGAGYDEVECYSDADCGGYGYCDQGYCY